MSEQIRKLSPEEVATYRTSLSPKPTSSGGKYTSIFTDAQVGEAYEVQVDGASRAVEQRAIHSAAWKYGYIVRTIGGWNRSADREHIVFEIVGEKKPRARCEGSEER